MSSREPTLKPWSYYLPLSLALLLGCWRAPFFDLDDAVNITENASLQTDAPWLDCLKFQGRDQFYYPVTMFSWRLERALWEGPLQTLGGANAWAAGIRFGNLLLHLLAAWFAARIILFLTRSSTLAGCCLLAFALHPLAGESICWPVERKTVLAGALALAAVYTYMRARSWRGLLLSAVLYALALLSKPSALSAFAILGVWELLGRPALTESDPSSAQRLSFKRYLAALGRLWPWVALTLASLLSIRFLVKGSDSLIEPPGGSLWTALLTDVPILWKYITLLLCPDRLSFYYWLPPVTRMTDTHFVLAAAALALLVALTIWRSRPTERKLTVFAWLWFLGALGPNLNLIPTYDLMHDRYLYFSAPGFWLALGLGLRGLAGSDPDQGLETARARLAGFALSALALGWSLMNLGQSMLYSNSSALLEESVRNEPGACGNHSLLGGIYQKAAMQFRKSGQRELADEWLEKSAREFSAAIGAPDFKRYFSPARLYFCLGVVLEAQGKKQAAEAQYALGFNPPSGVRMTGQDRVLVLRLRGERRLKNGDTAGALADFDSALGFLPGSPVLHLLKGQALLELGADCALAGRAEEARATRQAARQAFEFLTPQDPGYPQARQYLLSLPPPP